MAKTSSAQAKYRYTVVFEPAEEGGFVVQVPYLGITTQGETLEEGRAMAADAIEGHIACLIEDGQPIPIEPIDLNQKVFIEHLDIQL